MRTDYIGSSVFLIVILLAGWGLMFLFFGTFDFLVVRQCERTGYWQTGQIRVTCTVQHPQPKFQPPLKENH